MKSLLCRAAAVGLWAVVGTAGAATFIVTNSNDSGAGSLREAITLANASAPPNTVSFDPSVTGTILLTTGQIKVGAAMSIVGPGAGKLTIDGNANGRIFSIFVTSPTCPAVDNGGVDFLVRISGLKLTNALRGTTAWGGAIWAEHSLALDSVIIANSVAASGAGLGFGIQYPGQTLTISNSLFLNNVARPVSVLPSRTHWGGGLFAAERCAATPTTTPVTVSIANSVFSDNKVQPVTLQGFGGGVGFWGLADISIADSRIVDNRIDVPANSSGGYAGGGLAGTAKSLTIQRSEIARNEISQPVAFSGWVQGGGFYLMNESDTLQGSASKMVVKVINSTLSGNTSSRNGGAGTVFANVALELDNTTVTNNAATSGPGGGIYVSMGGASNAFFLTNTAMPTLKLASSIVGNNSTTTSDIGISSSGPALVFDASNSLIRSLCSNCSISASSTGNLVGVDPMLGPLAFNGGPMRSHALLAGSPAIGTGSNPLKLITDQRGPGFARETSGTVDMGATQFTGLLPGRLSVAVAGRGSGAIASKPAGINCPSSTCAADFDAKARVALVATPDAGSTFNGWSGSCTGTGICVVSMSVARSVTATFKPIPFSASTTGVSAGVITAPVATVTNQISFNSADVGKTGAVFITAVVPRSFLAGLLSSLSAAKAMAAAPLDAATNTSSLVLIQLTATGWKPVVNGQLIPYASGVLGDQLAAQTLLTNTSTATLAGAQFCVGYGTSASEMGEAGRMQLVASVPDASDAGDSRVSCLVTDSLQVQTGWNLLGNSRSQGVQAASLYSDASWVTAVWRWDTAQKRWQLYAPGMDTTTFQSLLSDKGYGVLGEIKPGDGYWVQATAPASVMLQSDTSFDLTPASLVSGWNLVTTATSQTPSALNTALGGLTSLWAWDTTLQAWYFYAPSLDTGTGLSDYQKGNGYLDFGASGKTLDSGVGFWLSRP
jgi:hypothetical protein